MNEREKALRRVQETGFMTDDLRLYLNTHPEDEEALRVLRRYISAERNAKVDYEKQYGSLTLEGVMQHRKYDWIDHVWPWEGEA